MGTACPEVGLRQFLELGGADGGPWGRLCAWPAFWVGLFYDTDARDDAWDLVKDWKVEEIQALRDEVPRQALNARLRNRTVKDIALDVLQFSHKGLKNRARLDGVGLDETHFLKPLFQIAHSGLTPAEELLAAYDGRWGQSADTVFQAYAH